MTSWGTFLSTVLPEEGIGWYCIGSYKKKTEPLTEFADTIEGAEKIIQKILDMERDVYFGVSKFITNENRQAINAGWNKAFFLDIDCGEKYVEANKGYLTQAEASEDLRRFCSELNLPRPNIVSSGNGIHVSWVLEESIMKDQWKATANLLKQQVIRLGLKVDPSKVTDLGMVLRVPDTFNFKSDPPKKVVWLKEAMPVRYKLLNELLTVGLDNLGLDLTNAPNRPMDETTRNLLGNYVSNFAEIMKSRKCEQLHFIYKNQATIEEPLWRAGLSVAQCCEDRSTAIHKMSEKHTGYTPQDTEKKANDTKGPYTCKTIDSINPGICGKCKLFNTITSPIQIHKRVAEAPKEGATVVLPNAETGKEVTYKIPELPYGYFRGKNGGVYKRGYTNEEGEEVEKDKLIFRHDFYVVKRMEDSDMGSMVWLRLHLPKDGVREFACPATSLMSLEKFKEVVSKKGVIGSLKEMGAIMDYITAYTKELQDRDKAELMRIQFGWCDDDTKFIVGDREISAEGIYYSPPSSKTMMFAPWMKPKGTLPEWKRVVNNYGKTGQEARAFLFFAGLGTPFMKFTGQKGLVYSITENESGTGKTTIQRVINSIYGHPDDLMLIKGDTVKSQFHQMGVYNNIPICVDEVTDMTKEAASAIAYGISQGRSNNRMKASSNEMRDNNTRWALSSFFSGNSSMHDKISALKATPEAEQLRIVEVEISADTSMTKEDADALFEETLVNNYGMAVDIIMEYSVTNLDRIKQLLKDTKVKFDTEANLSSKQRFYSSGAATAFVGAIIGKELGLHDIDVIPVWAWAVKYFSDLKDSVKSAKRDPLLTLGMFLNSHNRNLLVVDDASDKRTGLTRAPILEPYGDLRTRFEPDTNTLYIDADYFQAWCTEKQIAYKSTLAELRKIGAGGTLGKKAMAKGTALNSPSINAIRIDNKVLKLVDDNAIAALTVVKEEPKGDS